MTAATFDRVGKVLVECLGVDPKRITGGAMLADDLGADSLDITEVEMAIEEEFGVELPQRSGIGLESTVDQLVEILQQHLPPA